MRLCGRVVTLIFTLKRSVLDGKRQYHPGLPKPAIPCKQGILGKPRTGQTALFAIRVLYSPPGKSLETVAFQGFFFLIFGIDHLRTGGAGDQTRHGLGARELCYFGGSMSACVSIRFPITIPPDAVLTGSCIRGYFVTVRFSCPGSMSRDSGHGPMRSGEGLVPRILDSGLCGYVSIGSAKPRHQPSRSVTIIIRSNAHNNRNFPFEAIIF